MVLVTYEFTFEVYSCIITCYDMVSCVEMIQSCILYRLRLISRYYFICGSFTEQAPFRKESIAIITCSRRYTPYARIIICPSLVGL